MSGKVIAQIIRGALVLILLALQCNSLQVYNCESERTTYMVIDLTETEDCSARARRYQAPVEEKVQVLMVEGER